MRVPAIGIVALAGVPAPSLAFCFPPPIVGAFAAPGVLSLANRETSSLGRYRESKVTPR